MVKESFFNKNKNRPHLCVNIAYVTRKVIT